MAETPTLSADFDVIAPGIMVFAILLLIGYTATALSREAEQGTLHRFRLARVRAYALLGGVGLAQLVIASVAFALMLMTAWAVGFTNHGSYGLSYVVILLTAVSAVGVGMVLAALVRRREEAANLSFMATLPLGFLSGAFFHVPGVRVGSLGLYDLLPTTHAINALRAIMGEGAQLSDIGSEMTWLSLLAGAYFLFGAFLFWSRRLRRAVPGRA